MEPPVFCLYPVILLSVTPCSLSGPLSATFCVTPNPWDQTLYLGALYTPSSFLLLSLSSPSSLSICPSFLNLSLLLHLTSHHPCLHFIPPHIFRRQDPHTLDCPALSGCLRASQPPSPVPGLPLPPPLLPFQETTRPGPAFSRFSRPHTQTAVG